MSTAPTMSGYFPINGTELKEHLLALVWRGLEGHPDLQLNCSFPRVKFKVTIELHMEPQETSQKTIEVAGELGDPSIPDSKLIPKICDAEGDVGFETAPSTIREQLNSLRTSAPIAEKTTATEDEHEEAADSLIKGKNYAESLRNYLRPRKR